MGGNQSDISNIGTVKGQGYRIINVRPNSPLQNKVDVFFDFIIDAIPSKQPERTAKDILNKLTDESKNRPQRIFKKLQQMMMQSQNTALTLKIVSTKYRNVKIVQVIPNRNWNGSEDLIGITTRIERYDEAFETYFPFSEIRPNSPVYKSGIKQGQFLIGCREFKYRSINELLQNLYDRYFDKAVEDKNINFAVYNLEKDELRIVPILLARGWGDKGLLGCQFIEGHLQRFPKNLLEVRNLLLLQKRKSEDNNKIKKELSECNGASVQLIQSLKTQKNRKKKNIKNIRNLLLVEPSQISINFPQKQSSQKQVRKNQVQSNNLQTPIQYVSLSKFKQLQNRVATLEQMVSKFRQYISQMEESDQEV